VEVTRGVYFNLLWLFDYRSDRQPASALEAFRRPCKDRVLWVDAVCIDPQNVFEKGLQVSMMSDIYANAGSVLVWLGKSHHLHATAFEILNLLAFFWVERLERGLKAESPSPFWLYKRPKGSVFLSTSDKTWSSLSRGYHERTITLSRPEGQDENALLCFDKPEIWTALDDLFGNSYFKRTWIQQEVAVADAIYISCGHHQVPFDIFSAAYSARNLLLFIKISISNNEDREVLSSCVRDARERSRDVEFGSGLAAILATFNYSKETIPHDHIYAPLAPFKSQWACGHIKLDYDKPLSDVLLEAATCIILSRQDLYLWGNKSFYPNRTLLDLPSWVPEWTGPNCQDAVEHFSDRSGFRALVQGNFAIQGQDLHADACILDEIDFSAPLSSEEHIFDIIRTPNLYIWGRKS
jgi:hypothetical protein